MTTQELIQDSYALIKAFPSIKQANKPCIYVACLEAYNNGMLHGTWIDCTIGVNYVKESIREMLGDSPEPYAAEWAIHDYECFGSYSVDEYENIDELCEIAELLTEEQGELVIEIMNHLGSGTIIETAKEFLEDNYQGCYQDLEDYAIQTLDDLYAIRSLPDYLKHYIDYAAIGRDMDTSGDIFTLSDRNGTHVFLNN